MTADSPWSVLDNAYQRCYVFGMGRPDGITRKAELFDTIYTAALGREHRRLITGKIRGQTGLPESEANKPSAHLRWALQQMKTRGWSYEEWGELLTDFKGRGTLGTGPICILESVRAPFDGPAHLRFETIEQKYIRLAFVKLGFDPVPVYISEWNDSQRTFESVENVMLEAIVLAEDDERAGRSTFDGLFDSELRDMFGITPEALRAAQEHLAPELLETVTK